MLRELSISKGITQKAAAEFVGVPLRTYSNYENCIEKQGSIKYKYIIEKLKEYGLVDEENGLLSIEDIKRGCSRVLEHYAVECCYLFGSYAKGRASEKSDVDLLIVTEITGLEFFGLVEDLRTALKKRIDALNYKQLVNNSDLIGEILKDGVKVYG